LFTKPDPARTGVFGEDGPFGALVVPRTLRVRADDALDVDLVVPTRDGAQMATGTFRLALIIQGGAVSVERYHWLGAHLASRGFVVVMPHDPLDLAFFGQGDGLDALGAVRDAGARVGDPLFGTIDARPAVVLGHSLGGVVAAKDWLAQPSDISLLVLFASYPDPGDDVTKPRPAGARVLSLIGGHDGSAKFADVKAGAAKFAVPTTLAVVDGMTHYQFTDDPTAAELKKEGTTATVPTGVARGKALFLVDAALDDLLGRGSHTLDTPDIWPAGLAPQTLTATTGGAP
jgi:pimeloyl-ACP methyl ester carboxylesterase